MPSRWAACWSRSAHSSGEGRLAGAGLFGSSGAGGISASYTVPTQSVQTQASGNIGATGFATTTSAGSVIAGTNNTADHPRRPAVHYDVRLPNSQPAAAVSIGGNSTSAGAGYSNITSGTAFLLGGNNITLSQNGASITISGASQSVQTQASGNIVGSGFIRLRLPDRRWSER